MLEVFKKNRILFTISLLVLVILTLIFIIIQPNLLLQPNVDYSPIKLEVSKLNNNNEIKNEKNFLKLIANVNSLNNNKLTRQQQLDLIKVILSNTINAYAQTNDPKLFELQVTLVNFINKNFPENGKLDTPQCMDPSCAKNPLPKEISQVIDEINSSTISSSIKEEVVRELINFGYINDDHSEAKAIDFLFVAQDIRSNSEFVKTGKSEAWATVIENYIKNSYPKEYNNLKKLSL